MAELINMNLKRDFIRIFFAFFMVFALRQN